MRKLLFDGLARRPLTEPPPSPGDEDLAAEFGQIMEMRPRARRILAIEHGLRQRPAVALRRANEFVEEALEQRSHGSGEAKQLRVES